MKRPHPRGTSITPARITEWLKVFRYYRHPPDEEAIQQWLNYFSKADRDVAARILDCVQVIPDQKTLVGYHEALQKLEGWSPDPAHRRGRWFFVGFGGSGESGQAMARAFREANKLTSNLYNDLFCSATELPFKNITAEDHVVFIDDFSATGRQVCMAWPTIQELIAADASLYLILTSATKKAIQTIINETELRISVYIELADEDNIFSDRCRYFSNIEKDKIARYGKRANNKTPRGYGDCGLLLVLSHKTPNNTIPILHAYHDRWRGLFPRYLPIPAEI